MVRQLSILVSANTGTGLAHAQFYFKRHELPDSYFAKTPFIIYSMIAMNTWVWSTVFHARDTPLTEKLDYYCTTIHVIFSTGRRETWLKRD